MPISRVPLLMLLLAASLFISCNSSRSERNQVEPADQEDVETLKILNWNVLYGFNHGNSVQPGVAWIKQQSPDVLALQELNGNTAESLREKAQLWGHQYSAIHKEKGFPVGLTSTEPIEVIERKVIGFHHGYLHCKTHGIHFFVVHFWPEKDHEAVAIIDKIKPLLESGQSVVVLGDFNTNSRKDESFLAGNGKVTPRFDVVDLFESKGFVDVVHKHDKRALYSCPSPITIPKWSANIEEVKSKRQRIDFIFIDQKLQQRSISGTILRSKEIEEVSDHYPVVTVIAR